MLEKKGIWDLINVIKVKSITTTQTRKKKRMPLPLKSSNRE